MCVSASRVTNLYCILDFYHHGNHMLYGVNKDDPLTCKIKIKNISPYGTVPNKVQITAASRYDGIAFSSDKHKQCYKNTINIVRDLNEHMS